MDRKYKICPAFGASAKSRFCFPLSQPRCLPRALHSADFTRSFPRCRNEGEYWPKWLNFWGWWGIMSYHHLSRFQIFSDKSHLNSFKIHELSHFRLVRIKIIQIEGVILPETSWQLVKLMRLWPILAANQQLYSGRSAPWCREQKGVAIQKGWRLKQWLDSYIMLHTRLALNLGRGS